MCHFCCRYAMGPFQFPGQGHSVMSVPAALQHALESGRRAHCFHCAVAWRWPAFYPLANCRPVAEPAINSAAKGQKWDGSTIHSDPAGHLQWKSIHCTAGYVDASQPAAPPVAQ